MIGIPDGPRKSPSTLKTQLLVLGMIHGRHRDSERYSLEILNSVVESFKPDFWLVEIPPNRLHKAIDSFAAGGTVEESRVQRFPEYVDVMFPLSRNMPFEIIGAAHKYWFLEKLRQREDIELLDAQSFFVAE